ncbi:UPF0076 protein [Fibrella aestuarina BUZ 2]|uniref:UPF0076 protein n=1 Tax=Fibrella aestuarina BUZ 2 TaxID=1166018 RepID=I0K1Y0_9BACT|nr:RidA family protein [Fibrella aestuarina]CCG98133.1 UPF0076 protein [Fibrella aestuarina BUZ 2]
MKQKRRSLLKGLFSMAGYVTGLESPPQPLVTPASTATGVVTHDDVPLYSSATRLGNLLFLFGIGAHFDGDIKSHTDHVLNELEKELIKAGSSMDKVLKVSVLLHDPNDYQAMNEVYRGRFGPNPPVRTTVAVRSGIPNDSLVEIDCIAHL